VDCGVVVERIVGTLGGGAGGPVLRGGAGEETPPPYIRSGEWAGERLALAVLAVLGVDNQHVSERVLQNYARVYGSRGPRPGFRKCDFKRRVAVAFSVCNTLARLHMPRPPSYVTRLCDLPTTRPLLNLPFHLRLERGELDALRREDYELRDGRPQEYVDTACSHLGIPFSAAGEAVSEAERAEWVLHGRHPTVLAAAAIQRVLGRRGELGEARRAELCHAFDCRQRTVDRVLEAWDRLG
jgi:hypothetical protein